MSLTSDDKSIDEENAQPTAFSTYLLSPLCNNRSKQRIHPMTEEILISCTDTSRKIRHNIVLKNIQITGTIY